MSEPVRVGEVLPAADGEDVRDWLARLREAVNQERRERS